MERCAGIRLEEEELEKLSVKGEEEAGWCMCWMLMLKPDPVSGP